MECPSCLKKIDHVLYYGDAQANCRLKGNKVDNWEFIEFLSGDTHQYLCPECQSDITRFIEEK